MAKSEPIIPQWTFLNIYQNICVQHAVHEIRRKMSPEKLLDTSVKDINIAIQIYASPIEIMVTAERAKSQFFKVMDHQMTSSKHVATKKRIDLEKVKLVTYTEEI